MATQRQLDFKLLAYDHELEKARAYATLGKEYEVNAAFRAAAIIRDEIGEISKQLDRQEVRP